MSETESPPPETEAPETTEPETETETDVPETGDAPPETVARSELEKAIARRDKANAKARELQAELDKLREAEKPDPLAAANKRLVNAETRTVLTEAGVTDRDLQKIVIDMIDLSKVDVDGDGNVDRDAIEDKISALARAFKVKERTSSVRTRPGGGGETVDPDVARRRRFLRGEKR